MRLTVVGCSGSFPGPASAASCYLVEATGADDRTWRILLDLGSGALGPLQRYTSLYDVDAVLLSHLHPDHCLDLTGLYVALKYRPAGPAPAVPVHGPTGTAQRLA
jgi:ribonuclease BN (tRNA processing enzyme)